MVAALGQVYIEAVHARQVLQISLDMPQAELCSNNVRSYETRLAIACQPTEISQRVDEKIRSTSGNAQNLTRVSSWQLL